MRRPPLEDSAYASNATSTSRNSCRTAYDTARLRAAIPSPTPSPNTDFIVPSKEGPPPPPPTITFPGRLPLARAPAIGLVFRSSRTSLGADKDATGLILWTSQASHSAYS